jgi:hypothetical protein
MRVLVLTIALASVLSAPAIANENTRSMLDRNDYSWQFRSPAETSVRQTQLLIWCQNNPNKCYDGKVMPYGGGNGGDGGNGGSGTGIGEASAIGNQNVIVVDGDNNVINFEADQTNNGDVWVDQDIHDNVLDIETEISNESTVLNVDGDNVTENTNSNNTDNSVTKTKTVTTTNTSTKNIDVDVTKCCPTLE